MKRLLIGTMLAATLVFASPALAQTGDSGPTQAPDLESVGNFREGPPDDGGNPQTLVDYTFDQAAYLKGGNRSSFNLVPLDGGDEVPARGIAPEGDTEGDQTVTVLFNGQLDPANYARGFVDTGIVTSREAGANSENPLNINQSEDISSGGETENPDLVRVTQGGQNSLIYEFDQALTSEDVIQSNSGLRIYFSSTSQASTIRQKGAIRVERVSDTKLRAFFGEDLPEGKELTDAVGAFVQQGTVQAAPGEGGANNGANAFDEILLASTMGCTVTGTSESDTLTGTPQRDIICGLGGDDNLRGLDGDDTLRGGAGADRLVGGAGDDRAFGQNGEDELFGNQGQDLLRGGADQDLLVGGEGNDNLAGGSAVDRIFGQGGEDNIYGQQGDDVLRGGSGNDRLVGGDGEDNVVGASGDDGLFGIAADDILRGGTGSDDLRGGSGADNLGGGDGKDKRLLGQAGNDFLNSEDGISGELVNGGDGRDRCVTDSDDIERNCP